jgi:DNA-binding response OmpR family regulator
MKAVLRRYGKGDASDNGVKPVMVGENRVELESGKVYRNGEEIILTAMEYKLLLIFLKNRGQILTRQQILNNIWDEGGDFVNDNTLSVYVKRLRKKLDDAEDGSLIQTVRGLGYRMEKE